jgi:hypothetical protein
MEQSQVPMPSLETACDRVLMILAQVAHANGLSSCAASVREATAAPRVAWGPRHIVPGSAFSNSWAAQAHQVAYAHA